MKNIILILIFFSVVLSVNAQSISIPEVIMTPTPLGAVEDNGAGIGHFTFVESSGVDVSASKFGLPNITIGVNFEYIGVTQPFDVHSITGTIMNYFTVSYDVAEKILWFKQSEIIPGDWYGEVEFPIVVLQNSTQEESYNGININISAIDGVTNAIGNASVFTYTLPMSGNDLPIATLDEATTDQDTSVILDVVAVATDTDGTIDPTSVTVITAPQNGEISIDPTTGEITYTPDTGFNGTDTFEYQLCDNDGGCDIALVTITVGQNLSAPIANPDTNTTLEDTQLVVSAEDGLLNNDTDENTTDILSVTQFTVGGATYNAGETVTLTEGILMISVNGSYVFSPASNYSGDVPQVTYIVSDGTSTITASSTLDIVVTPVNDAPILTSDIVTTGGNVPVIISICDNDTDIDGTIDSTSVTVITASQNGEISIDPVTGEITYTPDPDFSGVDTFVYQVCDNDGNCSQATVQITVLATDLELIIEIDNDTPVSGAIVEFTITLSNIGDVDGTGIEVTNLLPSGYEFVSASPENGTFDENTGLWIINTLNIDDEVTLVITATVLSLGDYTIISEVTAADVLDVDSTPNNNDVFEDDYAEISIQPQVLLNIPEGLSPNGDGNNDEFVIENLQVLYPKFSMEIVNRWGSTVYKYTHNGDKSKEPQWWDGYSTGRMTLDAHRKVPEGTYFYTIYFNENGKSPQTGWVYLKLFKR